MVAVSVSPVPGMDSATTFRQEKTLSRARYVRCRPCAGKSCKTNGGALLARGGGSQAQYQLPTYPVLLRSDGEICVGFSNIAASAFEDLDF